MSCIETRNFSNNHNQSKYNIERIKFCIFCSDMHCAYFSGLKLCYILNHFNMVNWLFD